MTVYIAVAIGVALIVVVLAPFFVGAGGLLAAGASINSPEKLRAMKAAILHRFLADEEAHKSGSMSNLAWNRRKAFLINRYVDCARRSDFLDSVASDARAMAAAGTNTAVKAPEGAL